MVTCLYFLFCKIDSSHHHHEWPLPISHRWFLSLSCTADGWTPQVIPLLQIRPEPDSSPSTRSAPVCVPCPHRLASSIAARLPVTFAGRLTCQLTLSLYLVASRAPSVKPDSLVSHT
jgi:hypothetical protein